MPFTIIIVSLALLLIFAGWRGSLQEKQLRKTGTHVTGTIISNRETNARYRLGGNVNTPTVYFTTTTGIEIVGEPLNGFISQYEVAVPSEIQIIYNPKDPRQFLIDGE